MKVLGIITEYNPFHNGHKYHIEEAKKTTGADYVIAVMSGDFVQRGIPAIMSKYDRTMMALNNGVDLVFELPVCYCTGSAWYFALGAVTLLNNLGIVDYLCFGSESGDIAVLEEVANLFSKPDDSFHTLLYSYIKEGLTYPAARARAAKQILGVEKKTMSDNLLEVISEPNNILGIEYIKALNHTGSTIKPITIRRHMASYHESSLNIGMTNPNSENQITNNLNNPTSENQITNNIKQKEESGTLISSATAIRSILENAKSTSELYMLNTSVPQNVYDYFVNNHYTTYPFSIEWFSSIIKYKLMSESSDQLAEYLDVSLDLADRIKNIDIIKYNLTELSQMIKTKNITLTRVNRALIHILLNIKNEDLQKFIKDKTIYYGRVLGMKKEASHLIRKIKHFERLPVITKVSKANEQLDFLGMQMLNQDIFATHLYNQAIYDKYKTIRANEYKHGICII